MNITIVGIGKVGRKLAEGLSKGEHHVTLVDTDREVLESAANSMDIMGVTGNGASYDVLDEVGVRNADLLIATTDSDEINILACFIAKKLGAKHTIARIRNNEYEKQLRLMREDLGLSMTINPEYAVAREITRVLRYPNALKIISFSKRRIEMLEYRVDEGSILIGKKLYEIGKLLNAKLLVCVVERDHDVIIPDGNFVIEEQDIIYVTGAPTEINNFFRKIGVFKEHVKNVMIVGASQTAFNLVRLLKDSGMHLTVIDMDEENCKKFSEQAPHVSVICGDATDNELLSEEGIDTANAFVALTGLDETNIILSLFAKEREVEKVITKINKKTFATIIDVQNLLDTVVSTSEVTSEIILQYVSSMRDDKDSNVKTAYSFIEDKVSILEFHAEKDSSIMDKPFKDLKFKKDLLVAAIIHKNGQITIPGGSDCITSGDDVLVITKDQNLSRFENIVQ